MARFFNTAGPNRLEKHYTLDPLHRLQTVRQLIEEERYFILHAPRQTGKTTTMMEFMHAINSEGKYIALYVNIAAAQAYRNDAEKANEVIISSFYSHIRTLLPAAYHPSEKCFHIFNRANGMTEFIQNWMQELPKPLILFIDEVDALIGDSLISVLRQLRAGYNLRPNGFPHSVCMIGLRDIRDYRIFSDGSGNYVIGGSAFNIKAQSLLMANFTADEVRQLYALHTAETGQIFTEEAVELAYYYTQGQPWLVNALGRTVCFEEIAVPRSEAITAAHIREAVEVLILRRDVHLDQLADKLTEPRVENIIQSILNGEDSLSREGHLTEDHQYLIDLGLIHRTKENGFEIANPIYREVIPRELTSVEQDLIPQQAIWYVQPDGKLDFKKVITNFVAYYRENGETWLSKRAHYLEISHHILLMAWLQRLINGGGRIMREYATGMGRIDLVIDFAQERFGIEIKTDRNFRRERVLQQASDYATRMGLATILVIIFRKTYSLEKIGNTEETLHNGVNVRFLWL